MEISPIDEGFRLREAVAHEPARAVREHADRIERFFGASRADQHTHALHAGAPHQRSLDRIDDDFRRSEASGTLEPRGECSRFWIDDPRTPTAQRSHIALRRRVAPHFGVHRGTHHERRTARQRGCTQRIGCFAMHHARHQIRGRGCDDHDIRLFDPRRFGTAPGQTC